MKPLYRNLHFSLLGLLCCLAAGSLQANEADTVLVGYPEYDEEAVIARLEQLENDIVPPQYNDIVKSYIKTYTERRRESSQRILGRSVMYFPMFEKYLKEHNLPTDLKYLSVVESALNPVAISHAGAVGLWQFMPATARWLGLHIDSSLDERCDPHKSTDTALKYLTSLYKRFGDWELAIAAYNGGGGRVSRAMKRARSKDFWTIRRYLPRETSNYVPAFIAAYYLMHHYEDHNLVPEYPDLDLQLTKTIKVYERYTFVEIAQITELPLETIEALNPAYRKHFIPESTKGNYLTLPSRVMTAVEDYLHTKHPDPDHRRPLLTNPVYVSRPAGIDNSNYVKTIYRVRAGDSLEKLAHDLGITVQQIKAWNRISSNSLAPGQELVLFHPREFKRFLILKKVDELAPIVTLVPKNVRADAPIWIREHRSFVTKGGYLYYRAVRPESVFELSNRLPDIQVRDLIQLNGFKSPLQLIKPDSYVRIRKL